MQLVFSLHSLTPPLHSVVLVEGILILLLVRTISARVHTKCNCSVVFVRAMIYHCCRSSCKTPSCEILVSNLNEFVILLQQRLCSMVFHDIPAS